MDKRIRNVKVKQRNFSTRIRHFNLGLDSSSFEDKFKQIETLCFEITDDIDGMSIDLENGLSNEDSRILYLESLKKEILDEMKQFEQQQDPISRRFSNIEKTISGKVSFKMCATYIKNKMFQAGGSKGNDPLEIVEELVSGKNIQQKDVCTSDKRHHT